MVKRQPLISLLAEGVRFFNDRDEYREVMGEQAPPFDPDRPPKNWILEGDAAAGEYQYLTLNHKAGALENTEIGMQAARWSNLPGRFDYLEHIVKPTAARTENGERVDATHLCSQGAVVRLLSELGAIGNALGPFEAKHIGGSRIIYPDDEYRRLLSIVFEGRVLNCGLLLAARNRFGVDRPGQWADSLPDPIFHPDAVVTKTTCRRCRCRTGRSRMTSGWCGIRWGIGSSKRVKRRSRA